MGVAMNIAMKSMGLGVLLAACMPVAALANGADVPAAAPAQKVVQLAPGAVAFVAEGDGFRRDGPVGNRVVLPAAVLEVSPRGYVHVVAGDGTLWLDEMDVRLDPPKAAQAASCGAVSSNVSVQLAASRGAGESSCTR